MTTHHERSGTAAPKKFITTNTGRILRVNSDGSPTDGSAVTTTAAAAPVVPVDPARRTDVLFRVRRDEGHEVSAWWLIGAFVVTSGLVILLLSGVPYVAA